MNTIGIILQTIGYIILSFSICINVVKKYINFSWQEKPLEIRFFCYLLGIKNDSDYSKLFSSNDFPIKEGFSFKKRLLLNLPLLALLFVIIGVASTIFPNKFMALLLLLLLSMAGIWIIIRSGALFREIRRLLSAISNIFRNIVGTVLIVIVISYICAIFGYRIDLWRSFKEKIVDNLVVFDMPPRVSLYTQFPYEYGFDRKLNSRVIKENESLTIDKSIKPLWVGLTNWENKSLSNVIFIIRFFSDDVKEANKDKWGAAWQTSNRPKEYLFSFNRTLISNIPTAPDPPIELEFLKPGKYCFEYIVLCDDYKPLAGHFFIEYKVAEK